MATGEYEKASDDFSRASLAAKELLEKGGLSEQEVAEMRTLSAKAEHLASQAAERISLLSYATPRATVQTPDLSSYMGYDSTHSPAGPTAGDARLPGVMPEMNQKVKKWIEFYARDGGRLFVRWLKTSAQYMNLVQSILEREGVPGDLAYLVMIESGFNLQARSWAHAVGPWQFILGTARLFDLQVDPWVDERYDPETSTVAAARYLKHLYSLFGSWPLAIAAYNGGEGLVGRALQRQNTRDFWSLRLPRQTEEYVPQFMAALHIAKEPEKYCVGLEVPVAMPFEEVVVYGPLDLQKISQVCNISPDSVKLLNPSFKRSKTPARKGGMKVRVPAGTSEEYLSALSAQGIRGECFGPGDQEVYRPTRAAATQRQDGSPDVVRASESSAYSSPAPEEELYLTYRVRKGDSLYRISRNFGVSIGQIQEFNEVARGNVIRPGQKLLIPRDGVRLAEHPSDKHVRKSAKLMHVVRRGETLYEISRSYGVSVSDIAEWNDLTSRRPIRAGQRLVILPDENPKTTDRTDTQ
ncbi:MAG: LysM peptidoglycan-binding domain-containing protein [Candidatus Eisenbacteria bacterium]|nr:LysM peptidoglycan-binding domain-containing protein [Candidatus Eisenbacteria bacterium]